MSTFFVDPAMSAALWIVVKASLLLGVAAIVQAVLHRRASAATRHLVWTLAIVGVLLLPVLSLALPDVAGRRSARRRRAADAAPVVDRRAADSRRAIDFVKPPVAPSRSRWPRTSARLARGRACRGRRSIVGVYAAGVIVMLIHLAMQRWSVRRLAREATDVRGLRVDASAAPSAPAAWASAGRCGCFEAASAACRWRSARAGRRS